MTTQIKIPYFTLKRQYKQLEPEITAAVHRVLRSGKYVLGDDVESFENAFAAYCGAGHGIGVASGTDALTLALKALGVGKGDEVILPSFTFIATAFAVMHVGAKPVFCDVDPVTYTLDPQEVKRAIRSKTKAILPVHLYGHPAPMNALRDLVSGKKIALVEDAAQAHGAAERDRRTGSLGTLGCFSFYPTKNLGAAGDGGMVVTSDTRLAETVRQYRNLGRRDVGDHLVAGWTSRLDALQAVILEAKLKHLENFNESRRRIARQYSALLASTPLGLPQERDGARHVYHLYVVRVPDKLRNRLIVHLEQNGIATMVHYPKPVHRHPAYRNEFKQSWQLPVTDRLCGEILSLPMFPEMTGEEVNRVCDVIRDFFQ